MVDGGATRTAAATIASPNISVWGYEKNRGKGFAVIFGMLRAQGNLIGLMDAGGDIDPSCWIDLIAEQQRTAADAVVGSKRHPASAVSYPPIRRLYSFGYQLLSFLLFQLPVRDTQTGAKVFRGELVRTVAPKLLVKRFAFDVELLAVARHFGFRTVREVPVTIRHNFNSSVNLPEVLRMAFDSAAVFYRLHILRYYDRIDPQAASISISNLIQEAAPRRLQ